MHIAQAHIAFKSITQTHTNRLLWNVPQHFVGILFGFKYTITTNGKLII